MSTLHIRQLKAHFDSNYREDIDVSDVKGGEDEVNNSFYSRSTALFTLSIETGLGSQELKDWIVDDYYDNGIDALFFDSITTTFYLVQSKWHNDATGTIDKGSTQKFLKGVKDLLNGRINKFNDKVKKKLETINQVLDDTRTKICLVTTYTGTKELSPDILEDIKDFMNEQNDPAEIITHKNYRLKNLYQFLVIGAQGISSQQDVLLYGWNTIKDPYYAVYGQIAASDVAMWIETHGAMLFAPNIRFFLGETTVNEGIRETLISNPGNFWYFNNGITALCSSIEKKPIGGASHESGTFLCHDLRIVNGAQTVGTINKANNTHKEKVSKAKVQIRIISLDETPTSFEREVTKTNNTQNRIDSRDFVALDSNQERIKTELLLDGIEYVYKTGENYTDRNHGFDFVEAALARVYEAGSIEMVVIAKSQIGKLWADIETTPYKTLFNTSVIGPKVWRAVKILRFIDEKLLNIQSKSTGRDRLIAVHGNRAIAYIVFQKIRALQKEEVNAEDIHSMTHETYQGVLSNSNNFYPDSYPANLFKNISKTKEVTSFYS